VVYILSKILLKISYKYFPSDPPQILPKFRPDISRVIPFKFFPEILSKYSTDISPSIFLLRNTFRIIFQVPTNIFFITFLMLIRIRMPPVSYVELYKLISLINRGARASSHPTPSHFMATLFPPTPTPCSTQAHTSTRIVRSFFDRSSPCS
jgi:hypothetical protein